jgi:hypothetical protein
MHRSLGDMKIKKEPRHSGQRFLLIRRSGAWTHRLRTKGWNPGLLTTYWIPGQARHDGF